MNLFGEREHSNASDLLRLKDVNCREHYQEQLKAKLIPENKHGIWQRAEAISDPSDINGRWLHLKQTINDVAVKVLKPVVNPLRTKSYMSENTLNILEMKCNVFKSMETKGEEITFEVKKGWTKHISRSLRQDYKIGLKLLYDKWK